MILSPAFQAPGAPRLDIRAPLPTLADSLMARSPLPAGAAGIGLDLVEIREFTRLDLDRDAAFYRRCFTRTEIADCARRAFPAQHFAARFAAKEAAVKACSAVGLLAPWQVEVCTGSSGAPWLRFWDEDRSRPHHLFAGQMERRPASPTLYTALVSLTHTELYAAAIVLLSRSEESHGT